MTTLAFDVLWRDRGAAKGLQGLGKNAKEAEGRLGSLEKLGPRLGAAFAGLEVADFLRDSITAASDLNETVSKSQAIFGSSAAQVNKWAEGAATGMGLSKRAALDSASSFGDLFLQLGFTQSKALDLSEGTVQLASDLGSFSNLDTADVLERISAAYRGEYDGLQKVIPNISAARVEEEALRLTHKASSKELTAQDKALAVNAILHKDGARALGDFARTSGGAANQQRILAAEFENTKAKIGQELLPVMMTLIHVARDVGIPALEGIANVTGHIPTAGYAAAAGLVGLYGAIRVGSKAVETAKLGNEALQVALRFLGIRAAEAAAAQTAESVASGRQAAAADGAAVSAGRLGTAMGVVAGKAALLAGVAGLGLLFDQVTSWSGGADVAKVKTDDLSSALLNYARTGKIAGAAQQLFEVNSARAWGSIDTGTDALNRFSEEAVGAFSHDWTDVVGRLQSGGERVARFSATAQQLDSALAQMASNGHATEATGLFLKFADATGLQGEELQHVLSRFPQYQAAVTAAAQASARAAGQGRDEGVSIRQVAAAHDVAAGATRQHGSTLKALLDEFPKYKDQVLASAGATSAAKAATVQLTAAQVKQIRADVAAKQALDALTGALDANKNATLQLRGGEASWYGALADVTKAVKENGRTLDVHTAKGRTNRGALDSLASAGLNYLGVIQQNNGVGAKFRHTLDEQWTKLYDAARRFGATKTEARKYADQILAVPKTLALRVTAPGLAAARSGARGLASDISHINGRVITVKYRTDGSVVINGHVARAAGGAIPGWSPSKTADNVPVMATAGEHMWSVDEVRGAGGHAGVEQLRAAARAGALHLAAGGAVNRNLVTRYQGHFAQHVISDAIDAWVGQLVSAGGGGGVGGGGPGGSGVRRWASTILRALALLHQSPTWLNTVERRMQRESGGNPRAINLWDTNAQHGDPSKGLMQVIGATFRAYHVRGTSGNIYDPLANIAAGLNYALHRYGSLSALNRPGGYDQGGLLKPGMTMVANGTGRPERVLSPAQTALLDRQLSRVGGGAAGVVVNVTLNLDPAAHAFEDKVVRAVDHATRLGRLRAAS